MAGLITEFSEDVSEKGITFTFSGVELKGVAAKRIIMPPEGEPYLVYKKASPEEVMAGLISTQIVAPANEDRALNGSIAGYSIGDDLIDFEGRFGSLADTLANLAETYAIGWYADIQDENIVWHLFHSTDRTEVQSNNNRFVLSYSADTLQSSTLQVASAIPNVALVAGQGEGIERAIAYVGSGGGLSREEVYIDARDLEDANALPARGKQKLAEYGDGIVFDITLAPQMVNQYRRSFDLGDIGTIHAAGFSANCVLSEVTEVYEGGALLRIDTVFGYDKNTLSAALKRLNSNADTLVKTEGNTTGGGGGGSGGLTDYEGLYNKPKINSVELVGNKTAEQLGLSRTGHTHTAAEISGLPTVPTKTSQLTNDSGFVTNSQLPTTATTAKSGIVKPDGTTIKIDADGTIHSAATGGVSSFKGRTGAVNPQSGDYTASMVGAATLAEVNTAIQAAILDSWGAAY